MGPRPRVQGFPSGGRGRGRAFVPFGVQALFLTIAAIGMMQNYAKKKWLVCLLEFQAGHCVCWLVAFCALHFCVFGLCGFCALREASNCANFSDTTNKLHQKRRKAQQHPTWFEKSWQSTSACSAPAPVSGSGPRPRRGAPHTPCLECKNM